MNPMFYGTFAFLVFSGFLLAVGFWALHGIRKEEAAKRPAGFATAAPEARSRSAE
jgi:cbb3-type cytochrome oxidase subunit 3